VATSLRSFRADDAQAVVALSRQAAARPEEQVANPGWASVDELAGEISDWDPPATQTLVVADEDGEIVGFGGIEVGDGDARADLFGPLVARRAQGRRIGTRLLEESLAIARAHEASIVVAAVGTRNTRGRMLLERYDFVPRGGKQALYELEPGEHVAAPKSSAAKAVRRAIPADADAVVALHRECFPGDSFPESALRAAVDGGSSYVVDAGGRIRAFLTIDSADRWIYLVGVHPEERSRGLGGALLSTALGDYWRDHPGETLGLAVNADNTPAVRLYRRQGFRPKLLLQKYELAL
jgi:ribosomal protein S18 acetylase RimI-like enzyme